MIPALTLALLLSPAHEAPAQSLAVEGGKAYVVQGGTVLRIDLGTLQIEASRVFSRGPGPWDNRLVLARSADGLSCRDTGEVLVEAGGVPDLLLDARGRLLAIYQCFLEKPPGLFDRIAVSVSTDGKTWSPPTAVVIAGLPPTADNAPCDPDLVQLPDGRFRLYFTCDVREQGRGLPRTLSAVSTDGVRFEVEPGERLMDPAAPLLDPSAVRIGEAWHLFAPRAGQPELAHHAVSSDGLAFVREEDVYTEGLTLLGNVIPVPGGYRFYGSTPQGVRSAFSEDGYGWWPEEGVRFPMTGDPGVVRLPDGSYPMVHTQPRALR